MGRGYPGGHGVRPWRGQGEFRENESATGYVLPLDRTTAGVRHLFLFLTSKWRYARSENALNTIAHDHRHAAGKNGLGRSYCDGHFQAAGRVLRGADLDGDLLLFGALLHA